MALPPYAVILIEMSLYLRALSRLPADHGPDTQSTIPAPFTVISVAVMMARFSDSPSILAEA